MIRKIIKNPIEDHTPDEMVIDSGDEKGTPYVKPSSKLGRAKEVYDLLDKIEMPAGEDMVFLKGRNLPEENMEYDKKGYVSGLDHKQIILLAQLISERVGTRYTLPPFQRSYDEFLKGEEFYEMISQYCIPNREVVFKQGSIMPDSDVTVTDGELDYAGGIIETDLEPDPPLKTDGILSVLYGVRLFKRSEKNLNIHDGSIKFENNEAFVWSTFVSEEYDEYYVYATEPERTKKDNTFIIALVKADS